MGYAEEHEAPGHFRRVHADLLRLGGQRLARSRVAAALVDAAKSLPRHNLGEDAEAIRARYRAWLDEHWTEEDRAAERMRPFVERGSSKVFSRELGNAGWLNLAWPKEAGGQDLSPMCQLAMVQEQAYAGTPTAFISSSTALIGPAIIAHGSPFLKETVLPAIARGEVLIALGYSEAGAGSDLAALSTKAIREGDSYRVNGQKLWGTGTDRATHIALAVRTDPDASRKAAGISLLLVPADLPGITIRPSMAMYGHTFCTQFYDDVIVPAKYRIGPENGGWPILGEALAAERIQMGGAVAHLEILLRDLSAYVSSRGDLSRDSWVRDTLGELAADVEAARMLAIHAVRVLEQGRLPLVEGAMAKVFAGNLTERFSEAALDILGTAGTLGEDAANVPLDGRIEQTLRRSIMMVIGGGAAEIQKTIIAQRGIGLPR